MNAETAFNELITILPEKSLNDIVDSLYNAGYSRTDGDKLLKLQERLGDSSFAFYKKPLDKAANNLKDSVEELNQFLSYHYYDDYGTGCFNLYPEKKHTKQIFAADGTKGSWDSYRLTGLRLARKVKKDYVTICNLYKPGKTTKKKSKPVFPYKLPARTKWESVTICFKDIYTIFINVGQYSTEVSCNEMGLENRNTKAPVEQWNLLKKIATNGGKISVKEDKEIKQMSLLTKTLIDYFLIDFDPFIRQKGEYIAKFGILVDEQVFHTGNRKTEVEELFDEEMRRGEEFFELDN